jgi:cell division protein FtsA
MSVANAENIIVAVDIGTSKVCTIIAEIVNEEIDVIGIGVAENKGVTKGSISDIDEAANAIRKSVEKAEQMAGVKVEGVIVSISGKSISGIIGHGMTSLSGSKQKLITEDDVKKALEVTKSIPLSNDREILDIKKIQFIVDSQDEIRNPIGMTGMKLEVDAYIVTGPITVVQNITRVVQLAGYKLVDVVVQPLATAKAVLYPDEKDIGVLMLDIGAGTTSIAVYSKSALRFLRIIPVGGEYITSDIAQGLHIPKAVAEDIKKKKGLIYIDDAREDDYFEVSDINEIKKEKIHRKELVQFILPRVKELLNFVETELRKEGVDKSMYSGGIVITGGTALLNGIDRLIKERFNTRVRIGLPLKERVVGLYDMVNSPEYVGAIGLIDYYLTEQELTNDLLQQKGLIQKVLFYIKKFFSEFF